MMAAAIPTLGPVVKHARSEDYRQKNASTDDFGNCGKFGKSRLSEDCDQIQANLAHVLGIEMPGLGNEVTIIAGINRSQAKEGRHSVVPLSKFKAARATEVKFGSVATSSTEEEDAEKLIYKPKAHERLGI